MEDLETKITTWQREVNLKLTKSMWGAHVRTPEEDKLSEVCVCEPPRVCLCCHRPPETVERDLTYAYQGLKDTTKGAEPVEDHLPASIHQEASNPHSEEDMEDKIKLSDPMVTAIWRDKRALHTAVHSHDPQAQHDTQDIAARLDTTRRQLRELYVRQAKELAQEQKRYFQNPEPYKSLKHVDKVLGETGHRGIQAVRLQGVPSVPRVPQQ